MRLRTLGLVAILALSFGAPLAAEGQPAGRIPHIGLLSGGTDPARPTQWTPFFEALRELGYVEGQNIVIERRFPGGNVELIPELAADLARRNVDIIVATANAEVHAAKRATTTIPIVMVVAADPEAQGLVASLARPGGNVTGLTTLRAETSGKGLEILKQIVPRISRVAILGNPTDPNYRAFLEATESAARRLGLIVQLVEVRNLQEFEPAFTKIKRERVDALVLLADQVTVGHRKLVVEFTAKNHLPAVYSHALLAEAGGLISYGFSLTDQFRRAAYYVDKILKGAKPADLPIEQPTKFELVINLKTAKALGLTIPPAVLLRADRLIQ